MAVLEKEELKQKLIEHFSGVEDDSSIEMIEDISDTFDSFGGDDSYKQKYEELKKKYVERFTKKGEEKEDVEEKEDAEEEKEDGEVTEDDIFEERKENE